MVSGTTTLKRLSLVPSHQIVIELIGAYTIPWLRVIEFGKAMLLCRLNASTRTKKSAKYRKQNNAKPPD